VVIASPEKKESPPFVTVTEAGSGAGTSDRQLTIRLVGHITVGGEIRLRMAQLVTLLQNPVTSTQYCPVVSSVALVIVIEFVVAQSNKTPSFRHAKVNGP